MIDDIISLRVLFFLTVFDRLADESTNLSSYPQCCGKECG
ncbi:hypothetical protein CLOBOL_03220 [Enterocloster bolteae ATCC BAA-613]|uniref:Uncharacterized protein n=1 Tax=Enterocloster bolteae (strain ATCC BAA-613 / DSM 15670 / CCUG 46953 / JCM 12243 / WAL 16351) TaxID=411902 RepID=A8RS72_ENTBW|nr:hypothetical protein CLOBOL_03220 [Enterocloster bolteae ATCC BAA-613]